MNERIKELLSHYTIGGLQSFRLSVPYGQQVVSENVKCLLEAEVMKFAELIVQGCAIIADEPSGRKPGYNIRKHFGVEE